jgi:hypothetical protein
MTPDQMDYRAALAALDAKAGRIHTLADCRAAYAKSIERPEELDDRDLILIGFVHGEKAVSAARVRQVQSAAAIAEAQLPMATKSAETQPPVMTEIELHALVEGVANGLKPILERYKTQIAALEQANKDLEARVLELEAQAAASKVGV